MRAHRTWVLLPLLAVAVLVGAIGWVPAWLQAQAGPRASALLGRVVQVGAVQFEPWSLRLRVADVLVAAAQAGPIDAPALAIAEIDVQLAWASLWHRAPVLDHLTLRSPRLRLARLAAHSTDWDDVLQRLAAPAPDQAAAEPARFAVHNLQVLDGHITLHDHPSGRQHQVDGLTLAVPFLSNLPVHRAVTVQPHVAFRLDGAPVESAAESTPFAASRATRVRLQVAALALDPWMALLPAHLPLRPAPAAAGQLSLDLRAQFEQGEGNQAPRLSLSGSARLQGLTLQGDGPVALRLLLPDVRLSLRDVQPLQRRVHFDHVELHQPRLQLTRTVPAYPTHAPASAAAPAVAPSASAAPSVGSATAASASGAALPWQVQLDQLRIRAGAVDWADAAQRPAVALEVAALTLDADALDWPMRRAAKLSLSAAVGAKGRLNLQARTPAHEAGAAPGPHAAEGDVTLAQIGLAPLQPYLAPWLAGPLGGHLDLQGRWTWQAPSAPADSGRATSDWTLALDELAWIAPALPPGPEMVLAGAGTATAAGAAAGARAAETPRLAAEALRVSGARVESAARTVHLGQVRLQGLRGNLVRSAQGTWGHAAWLPPEAPAAAPATAPSAPAHTVAAGVDPPWRLGWSGLQVANAQVQWHDALPPRGVRFTAQLQQLQLGPLAPTTWADAWQPQRAAQAPLAELPIRLDAVWALPARDGDAARAAATPVGPRADGPAPATPGQVQLQGQVLLGRPGLRAQVQARQLPAHLIMPYLLPDVPLRLRRADTTLRASVNASLGPDGPRLQLDGDAALENLRVTDPAAGSADNRDVLLWASLGARGLALAWQPGQPPDLRMEELALTDFFAHIGLGADGHFRLSALPPSARRDADPAPGGPPAGTAAAPPSAAGSHGPRVRIGATSLVNGRLIFDDRYVQPNYSAEISELTGRLGRIGTDGAAPRSSGPTPAALDLRGRVAGSATLELTGQLDPLHQPPVLDLTGRVRGLDLPPLSPYVVRYAGHGIELGKLHMDVHYRISPDGSLDASNRLLLHSLRFTEPVPGAAASLPVRLAAALLADADGVIDLDLPITGSLHDPEFRVAPLVGRLLGQMVVKAVTSPFRLLQGVGSAAEALPTVPFVAGSGALGAAARAALDPVVHTLRARPNLRLQVRGAARLADERQAWQRERVHEQVQAELRRRHPELSALQDAIVSGANNLDEISRKAYLEAENEALRVVYRRAPIPKPRNALGLPQELSAETMVDLLAASVPSGPGELRQLAQRRAEAVRAYLLQQGVAPEALFVAAVQVDAADGADAVRGGVVPGVTLALEH